MSFHPYLYFGGNCREAMTRYQEIFGGELNIMEGSQAPPGAVPEGKEHLVMHAGLQTGDEVLMASDSYGDDFNQANTMYVHYTSEDHDRALSVFAALKEGGEVQMEGPQFWTPFYGQCIDRFGIGWQVSLEQPVEDA